MATGYYDAEGVWIYGESDSIALVTDLLNLGENSVSDQFTLDRSRITAVEANLGTRFAAASSTARDAHFGVPANDTQRLALQNTGAVCVRTDTGITEAYYATYNASTNPGGASLYGWYPIGGAVPKLSVSTATSQSFTTTWANATFATPVVNENQGFTFSSGVATIPTSGLYRVTGTIVFVASTSGTKAVTIYRTGSATTYFGGTAITTAVTQPMTASAVAEFTAGDSVSLQAYANVSTGSTSTVSGVSIPNTLTIEWLGVAR